MKLIDLTISGIWLFVCIDQFHEKDMLKEDSRVRLNRRSGSPFPSEKFVQINSKEKRDSGSLTHLLNEPLPNGDVNHV